MYAVKRDGRKSTGLHFVYSDNVPTEIWCKDEHDKKIILKPTKADLDLIDLFSYDSISLPYPNGTVFENSRINVKKHEGL